MERGVINDNVDTARVNNEADSPWERRSKRATRGQHSPRLSLYSRCAIDACRFDSVDQTDLYFSPAVLTASCYLSCESVIFRRCYLSTANIPIPHGAKDALSGP